MLRIDRDQKRFTTMDEPNLAEAAIQERYDLQKFILNSPEHFFAEVDEELFIVGSEIQPSEIVQDRIDILAFDHGGNSVIVELKREKNKLQLLQAIAYAGMIAKWTAKDFLEHLDNRREMLEDFLNVDSDEVNLKQRIILVAEAYDFEVLVGAEWLHDKYELDIRCCRIALSVDPATKAEYLACEQIFPAPELEGQAVLRRRGPVGDVPWPDWDHALANLNNTSLADFYRSQLQARRESYLPYRQLIYRMDGKRRWFMTARATRAFCLQKGRFEEDMEFWSKRLSDSESLKAVRGGRHLRFSLSTEADFVAFERAVTEELLSVEWAEEPTPSESEDGDSDNATEPGH